jgi:hypothetical protein
LTADGRAKTSGHRVEPARIAAFGRAVAISTVRTSGLLALLLCALAAGVLAAVARIVGPVAEAERVRSRYGNLILPVLPVVLAPGRPVVDVPDVASLARLAERYGLLVLHWNRGGVDTYVVQDESMSYRHRAVRGPCPSPDVMVNDRREQSAIARESGGNGHGRQRDSVPHGAEPA